MRILIATDAWAPQVNGVVRTLQSTARELERLGHEVRLITPEGSPTVPLPTYPEVRLALFARPRVLRALDEFRPNAVHIATEGPIGLATRQACLQLDLPFTTSLHTRFAEYVEARTALPASWTWTLMRWFHRPAARTMVSTPGLLEDLAARGFHNLHVWSRGVDTDLFRPGRKDMLALPRPVHLCVGRVAVEKNLEALLSLDLPGSTVVVGDGPQRAELQARFPVAHFLGKKEGAELAALYAASDVFVFPSRSDTFGLVMLEALACGVPVAAYPVQGPRDVLGSSMHVGVMNDDLKLAISQALTLSAADCTAFARQHSWRYCTLQFLENLEAAAVAPHHLAAA